MTDLNNEIGSGRGRVSVVLFAALFAGQAALIAMSPVLAEAARDLGVSTAAAGQLRTVTGLAAALAALAVGRLAGRVGLGRLLLEGSLLLAFGSIASAAAPSYSLLVLAQLPVGVGVAVVTSAGTLAAAEWVPPDVRTRTLSWALVGQPAAWIVGMPLVGLVGERSWRYGWLVLPLAAAVAAASLVAPRAGARPAASRPAPVRAAVADRTIARWLASELLANTAWAGTLVFAGALFTESYGTATAVTGCLLAVAAGAYIAGNLASRRLVQREPRRVLVLLASSLALVDALFGSARIGVVTTTMLLAGGSLLAGGRTLVASAFAISTPAHLRPAVTSLRASTMQLGYFGGSLIGGAALMIGGYGALGLAMGLCFAAAASLARSPITAHARATSSAPTRQPSAATPSASRAAARSAVSYPSSKVA
jgi:DHA1 family inner membrane transport protein